MLMTSIVAISLDVWPSAISFQFSRREHVVVLVALVRSLDEVADECVYCGGVEKGLPSHGRTAGFDDVIVGSGLEDIAGSTRLQRLEQELLVLEHREDQRPQFRASAGELVGCLESGLPGHADVEDCEVDGVVERALDCLGAVGGFRGDRQVGLVVEDPLDAFSDECVIIGNEDSCDGRDRH